MLTKVHIVKAMVFPVVMYGYESCTIKKAECQRIDAFKLWCWRRLLRVPWTARRSNQSILKEISPEYSLEGLMLKLKLQYLATWCEELTHLKRPWCWERLKVGREGATENEMAGWHHQLNGHEFEQTAGDSEGQRSVACCSPWGHKGSDMTYGLHNSKRHRCRLKIDCWGCLEWGSNVYNRGSLNISDRCYKSPFLMRKQRVNEEKGLGQGQKVLHLSPHHQAHLTQSLRSFHWADEHRMRPSPRRSELSGYTVSLISFLAPGSKLSNERISFLPSSAASHSPGQDWDSMPGHSPWNLLVIAAQGERNLGKKALHTSPLRLKAGNCWPLYYLTVLLKIKRQEINSSPSKGQLTPFYLPPCLTERHFWNQGCGPCCWTELSYPYLNYPYFSKN